MSVFLYIFLGVLLSTLDGSTMLLNVNTLPWNRFTCAAQSFFLPFSLWNVLPFKLDLFVKGKCCFLLCSFFFLLARASAKINSGLTVCLTTRQLNIVHVIYFFAWNMMEVKPDFILSQHFRFWFFLSRQWNRFVLEIYTDKNQLVLFLKSTSTNVF